MLWAALTLTGSGLYIQEVLGAGDSKPAQVQPDSPYRIGETLKPGKAGKARANYEETYWESLCPNGWEANNLLEWLNLNELGDNDPRAKEVMTKIREMWDNAPVNTDLAAVWVSGTIHTVRSETRMGSSGYEMTADLIEPYKLEEWSPI